MMPYLRGLVGLGAAVALTASCATHRYRSGPYQGCDVRGKSVECYAELRHSNPAEPRSLRFTLLEFENNVKRLWLSFGNTNIEIWPARDPGCERKLGYYSDWCGNNHLNREDMQKIMDGMKRDSIKPEFKVS